LSALIAAIVSGVVATATSLALGGTLEVRKRRARTLRHAG
jgi:hypothetical protein